MTKMHGFSDVQLSNPDFQGEQRIAVIAKRAVFKAGGTSLKNRKKKVATDAAAPADNPWANLGNDGAAMQVDEDALMQNEATLKAITEQFSSGADRIMPGKPCDNCNCGAKEIYEGKVTIE